MGSLFEKIDEENTHDTREGSDEIGGAIAENYVMVSHQSCNVVLFSFEILPWDIFFDLLDNVINGILIHASLLLQKCWQLVRVLESRHEALD